MIKIIIDPEKCNGCGKCIEGCGLPIGEYDFCIDECKRRNCSKCKRIKKYVVLKLENGKVVINNLSQCKGGRNCMDVCESGAILIEGNYNPDNMCAVMQDAEPIMHCYYCEKFQTCITCQKPSCENCNLCFECRIYLSSLAGPWFTSDGEKIE